MRTRIKYSGPVRVNYLSSISKSYTLPEKQKPTIRINKAYLQYFKKHGFSPLVHTELIERQVARAHLLSTSETDSVEVIKEIELARKRLARHNQRRVKMVGYEPYLNKETAVNKESSANSWNRIVRENYITVGRRISINKNLDDDYYFAAGRAHLNKSKATTEVAA